ncbi:MAG: hypothetical protein HDS21_06360 [Bacteroides sp.]|nr:hypothetical protein [Bacteroides sp.]
MLRHIKTSLLLLAAAAAFAACDKIDNHRIPPVNVNIIFNTIGDWHLYGVSGAGQSRQFIRALGLPAGYPYKVSEYTGFGGVLLVCDPNGEYLAYDLACPVEAKADIRVQHDPSAQYAGIVKCPECGSTYDLYNHGAPASGEAYKLHYGLESYIVFSGNQTPPYAYIRR